MKTRYLALDFFRGLTIALMIVVNTPGTWEHVYAPLRHAPWHGCTPTDLVFPFFLFIVGVAMWFTYGKRSDGLTWPIAAKLLRRTALIFLIGLALNAFPFFNKHWESLRIMGVLQRIGLAFGAAGFICVLLPKRAVAWAAAALLLAYWGILWYFGGDDPYGKEGNIVRHIDMALLGPKHLYQQYGLPFDPEGLFSTLPAIVNVLLGYLTGSWIAEAGNAAEDADNSKKALCLRLLRNGVLIAVIGWLWDVAFPVNKPLWTSSYVLYTSGLAMIFLSLCIWMFDIRGWKSVAQPFLVFGANPLFAYVLSGLIVKTLMQFKSTGPDGMVHTAYGWIYPHLFAPINDGPFGSLLFALTYALMIWLLCWILYRKNILIKI